MARSSSEPRYRSRDSRMIKLARSVPRLVGKFRLLRLLPEHAIPTVENMFTD